MKTTSLAILTLGGLVQQPVADSVFTVTYRNLNGMQNEIGTAFRLKGTSGLVTALHCVSGLSNPEIILSSNKKKLVNSTPTPFPNINKSNDGLRVVAVCKERDLAILDCSMLKKRMQQWSIPELVLSKQTIGYGFQPVESHGSKLNSIFGFTYLFTKPNQNKLQNLLTFAQQQEISHWGSPKVSEKVVSLSGLIYHGYSGGPVLNSAGEVFAVTDGGIDSNHWWAMRLDSVPWKTNPNEIKSILGSFVKRTKSPLLTSEKVVMNNDQVKEDILRIKGLVEKFKGKEASADTPRWSQGELYTSNSLVRIPVYAGDNIREAGTKYANLCYQVSGLFPAWIAKDEAVTIPGRAAHPFKRAHLDLEDPESKQFVTVEIIDNGIPNSTGRTAFPDQTRFAVFVQVGKPERI